MPFASAVVVLLAAPLSVTVAPEVVAAGLKLPDREKVCTAAVKLTAVFDVPVIVTFWLVGLKMTPLLEGVTV